MIYRTVRWITGVALHWFYRDISVIGMERIPPKGPLLIAVNHQNALVDSLIVGWVIPRRVTMTAKATLTDNPLISGIFRLLNVVPLRRTSDELRQASTATIDRTRNVGAFRQLLAVLGKSGAVLIFPEGKSHNENGLEPLKTGLARLALQARTEASVRGLKILPLGLVFEDKGTPGTLAVAHVGEAIDMDVWAGNNHLALTREIADRLRSVSEAASFPQTQRDAGRRQRRKIAEICISVAAWWGRTTHALPIRVARKIAVGRSRDADQPAMLTILFGIMLVLLTYAIHLIVLGAIVHTFWVEALYLVSLLCGAYWAAFQPHPQGR